MMSQKIDKLFEITQNISLNESTNLLKIKPQDRNFISENYPGQFVNIKIEGEGVFLRRPISICNYDGLNNEIWLTIKKAGKGSDILTSLPQGSVIRVLLPLGQGFSLPSNSQSRVLLIGGGVGLAPLYYLGQWLSNLNIPVNYLVGARTGKDLILLEYLEQLGKIHISTDDGSVGEKGIITQHPILEEDWDNFYVCGPQPMMKAVANIASSRNIECEVSLENHMACGLGACLCCVENTKYGNLCVCTEGPVFNINKLQW